MTAVEQSALGPVVVARNTRQGAAHDRSRDNGQADDKASTFEDLVSAAEQKLGDVLDGGTDSEQQEGSPFSDMAASAQPARQIRIATNLATGLKVASKAAQAEDAAEAATNDQKSVKSEKVENHKHKATSEAAEKDEPSPSEQLSALLGIAAAGEESTSAETTETTSAPVIKKVTKHDEKDEDKSDVTSDKSSVSSAIDVLKATVSQADMVQHQSALRADEQSEPADEVDSAADIIRLVSKDSKGTPVDIPMTSETTSAEPASKSQPAAKTDFVTVLESRRYLGFSADTNATALAGAIKSDPSWSSALQAVSAAQTAIEGNTTTTVNTLKLQMNPESLGSMTASLRLKGDELSVEVKVETVEAYRHLSKDHNSILKALQDQGFSIDQVAIQLSAPDKSTDLSQDRGDQSSNGQDARDSLGQNAKQREENERRTGNQGFWRNNEETSSQGEIDNTVSGDSTSGNIYL